MDKITYYKLDGGRQAEIVEEKGSMHMATVNLLQGEARTVEVERTPLQECGLVTFCGGAYALIRAGGETTVHATGKHTDDDVIDAVYTLSEKMGLMKAIMKYKERTRMLDPMAEPEGKI